MMAKKLLVFSLSLMALIFTACSSDSEDAMGTSSMYEYSADEIQQIQKLQEEYGVSFDYTKKSVKPLPTLKDMEEVCKFAACLTHAKSTIIKNGNSFIGTTSHKMMSRSYSGTIEPVKPVKEIYYSGNHEGYGSIGEGYGTFSYRVSWNNTNSKHPNNVTGEVLTLNSPGGWNVHFDSFSYNISGSSRLDFAFYFSLSSYHGGSNVNNIKYEGSTDLAGQSTSIH